MQKKTHNAKQGKTKNKCRISSNKIKSQHLKLNYSNNTSNHNATHIVCLTLTSSHPYLTVQHFIQRVMLRKAENMDQVS